MRIIGNTVGLGLPKPDLMQIDPKKGDFVHGKDEFLEQASSTFPGTAKSLLMDILRNGVYTTDQSANIMQLAEALTTGGIVRPEDPDISEASLTHISATYSGGDVAAGTAVSDLVGIEVIGHYSDGSTEVATDYTLSGTIVEGENTITVRYFGMTATFTVVGVAESSGGVVAMSAEMVHKNMSSCGVYTDGGNTEYKDARFPTTNGRSSVSENVFDRDTRLRITLTPSGNVFQCLLFCSTLLDSERNLGVDDSDVLFCFCESSNVGFTYGWSTEEHVWEYTVKAGYKFGVISINAGTLPTKVEVIG